MTCNQLDVNTSSFFCMIENELGKIFGVLKKDHDPPLNRISLQNSVSIIGNFCKTSSFKIQERDNSVTVGPY